MEVVRKILVRYNQNRSLKKKTNLIKYILICLGMPTVCFFSSVNSIYWVLSAYHTLFYWSILFCFFVGRFLFNREISIIFYVFLTNLLGIILMGLISTVSIICIRFFVSLFHVIIIGITAVRYIFIYMCFFSRPDISGIL